LAGVIYWFQLYPVIVTWNAEILKCLGPYGAQLATLAQKATQYVINFVSKSEILCTIGTVVSQYASVGYRLLSSVLQQMIQKAGMGQIIGLSQELFSRLALLISQNIYHISLAAGEMTAVSYTVSRVTPKMIAKTSEKYTTLSIVYKEWRRENFQRIAQERLERQMTDNAAEIQLTELRTATAADEEPPLLPATSNEEPPLPPEAPVQLPPPEIVVFTEDDLDRYECPITYAICEEPVRVVTKSGFIQYYEREFLISWMDGCRRRGLTPFAPKSKEELPFRSIDEVVVDEEAQQQIQHIRAAIQQAVANAL
jgi:hypothetical protein